MRSDPLLFVRDVPASSLWYQRLLGAKSGHGGDEYEMIVDDEKNVLVQLHHLDGEEHGDVGITKDAPRGVGVLIYILVEDVRAVHATAVEMGADVQSDPVFLELAHHTEFVVADPDGYRLAVYSPGGR